MSEDLIKRLRSAAATMVQLRLRSDEPLVPDLLAEAADALASQAALIAEAREDALEEAAKVAAQWLESSWRDEVFAARSIADAIRSLQRTPAPEGKDGAPARQGERDAERGTS